jgi:hypothetical protein
MADAGTASKARRADEASVFPSAGNVIEPQRTAVKWWMERTDEVLRMRSPVDAGGVDSRVNPAVAAQQKTMKMSRV